MEKTVDSIATIDIGLKVIILLAIDGRFCRGELMRVEEDLYGGRGRAQPAAPLQVRLRVYHGISDIIGFDKLSQRVFSTTRHQRKLILGGLQTAPTNDPPPHLRCASATAKVVIRDPYPLPSS